MSKVCVLGGTGFIGRALCAALAASGNAITLITRDATRARPLAMLPGLRVAAADPYDAAQLERVFADHDAVVNLVGILNERGRDGAGFRRAHTELAARVVRACRAAGVERLLHMSSLGADADRGPSHYLRSKGAAERALRDDCGDVRFTIFQPSIVFGAGDSFTNRFAGLLRLAPVLPLARPDARFAPVWVDDVVAAFLHALDDRATAGETFQLCGPRVYTFRELVTYVRDTLGLRTMIVGLPDPLSQLQAAIMDFVPGKPFSTDNYLSLTVDSVCTRNGFARLGLTPHSLETIAPGYLGGRHERSARNDRYRRSAGR